MGVRSSPELLGCPSMPRLRHHGLTIQQLASKMAAANASAGYPPQGGQGGYVSEPAVNAGLVTIH
jgi:hypothetical protein